MSFFPLSMFVQVSRQSMSLVITGLIVRCLSKSTFTTNPIQEGNEDIKEGKTKERENIDHQFSYPRITQLVLFMNEFMNFHGPISCSQNPYLITDRTTTTGP